MALRKMPKKYSKHNAASAKSHIAAHTKAEKRNEEVREEETRQAEAIKNQDESRIRTLQKYGQEYRGRTQTTKQKEQANQENIRETEKECQEEEGKSSSNNGNRDKEREEKDNGGEKGRKENDEQQ